MHVAYPNLTAHVTAGARKETDTSDVGKHFEKLK